MKKGKIIKVSGPLIVAEGMEGVKNYEVVKASRFSLIGEVIELNEDKASIQVYEETSGVGPGEPVYATGSQLSVELGPGLIGSIYDGIQRPLESISKKSGDFIKRGIEVPAFSKTKKWNFEPILKKGDKVQAGDILGEVKETPLVTHKIMVPPQVKSGQILEIKQGKFTVEDEIAKLKQENGEVLEIKMSQKWPIRQPRPVKKKLLPTEPLITGQRVIDTFFPIAKGGAGCVPGPFGAGKCVVGETPVLLKTGQILPIKEIFEKYDKKGEKRKNKDEEYTVLDKPFEVLSYKEGKISNGKVTAVYKGKSDSLIKITTKTGRELRITPIHKLFKLDDNLGLKEKQAQSLKEGDYIAMPRVLPSFGEEVLFDAYEIFSEFRVVEDQVLKRVKNKIEDLRKKIGSLKKLAEKMNVSYDVLMEYYHNRNKPTLNFVKRLYQIEGEEPPLISRVKGERQSKSTKIPQTFTKDIAEFLGLIFSEGSLKKNSVYFYNNCKKTQKRFNLLCKRIFGLIPKREIANTVDCSSIFSVVLAHFLKYIGMPEYKKSTKISLPAFLLSSNSEKIGAFLGAYFVGDGSFSKKRNAIEISTSSREMSTGISYLLQRLGILYSQKSRETKANINYRINIYGKDNVSAFYNQSNLPYPKFRKLKSSLNNSPGDNLGSRFDILPIKSNLLRKIFQKKEGFWSLLRKQGIAASNYLSGGENITVKMFQKMIKILGIDELEKFAFNDLSHIFFDKIESIEVIEEKFDVYDLEVEECHNFIGGNAPCFFHNTIIQHQISKWADADIIIFIGCGERGNEMTDVLKEFPELKDPKTGRPLMERTILIANTSNMPVAAREASIYTGITLGEYFRDMGYNVALMADSTSRWAEALREISGRLEEMPGEEGYPAYLGSRTASFYERAGYVVCEGRKERKGSLTVIGSVSPPGGDLSEPVTQNTLRVSKVFWSLDKELAHARHFPAIDWLSSYSLYLDNLSSYFKSDIGDDFIELREEAMRILNKEAELEEIVRLVGYEGLSGKDKLFLETAKSIREDFLLQNAFDERDTYTRLEKQYEILKAIIEFHKKAQGLLQKGKTVEEILELEQKKKIPKMKYQK